MAKPKVREDNYTKQIRITKGADADIQRTVGLVLDLSNAPAFAIKEALETFEEQLSKVVNLPRRKKDRIHLETINEILQLILEKRGLQSVEKKDKAEKVQEWLDKKVKKHEQTPKESNRDRVTDL